MKHHHILIVDDERAIRHSLRETLERKNYQISEASDGLRALVKCKRHSFDLVLMNIGMPMMNGIESLERIRYFWPGLPVIMFSGSATVEIVEHVIKMGAYGFLSKPVDSQILLDKVSGAILKRQTYKKPIFG